MGSSTSALGLRDVLGGNFTSLCIVCQLYKDFLEPVPVLLRGGVEEKIVQARKKFVDFLFVIHINRLNVILFLRGVFLLLFTLFKMLAFCHISAIVVFW